MEGTINGAGTAVDRADIPAAAGDGDAGVVCGRLRSAVCRQGLGCAAGRDAAMVRDFNIL